MEFGHYLIRLQGIFFLIIFLKPKLFLSQLEEHPSFLTDSTKWRGGSNFLPEPCKQGSTHLNCFASSNSRRSYLESSRKYRVPFRFVFSDSRMKSLLFQVGMCRNQPGEGAGIAQLQLQISVALRRHVVESHLSLLLIFCHLCKNSSISVLPPLL